MTTSAEATEEKQVGTEFTPHLDGKTHTYYGIEYRFSVEQMAKQVSTSVRTAKTFLKLKAMGYQPHIDAGWTAAQCFAHAGMAKRKPAPKRAIIDEFKTVIINYREQMDDAVYEIKRLRDLLHDLGVDPDE